MQLPKLNKKITLAAILSFAFLLNNTLFANAQTSLPLSVAPARQELVVEPGTSENLLVKFANYSDSPLSGIIKAVDFVVKDSTGTPYLLEGENVASKYSAASWIQLPFPRASIAPGNILQVPISITAPADAAAGGRYVAVYFEPTGALPSYDGVNQQGASGIIPRVAGLIYIRVAGPISEIAQVVTFKTPNFIEYGPIAIETEIVNLGNYHISPRPKLTLTNLLTNAVTDTVVLDEQNIFPEVSRAYQGTVGKKWLVGRYRVDMVAPYGESGQGLLSSAFVWAFPWRIALLILLTLMIVILAILLISKSLTQKQHVLEEKLSEELEEVEKLKEKYEDRLPQMPVKENGNAAKK